MRAPLNICARSALNLLFNHSKNTKFPALIQEVYELSIVQEFEFPKGIELELDKTAPTAKMDAQAKMAGKSIKAGKPPTQSVGGSSPASSSSAGQKPKGKGKKRVVDPGSQSVGSGKKKAR